MPMILPVPQFRECVNYDTEDNIQTNSSHQYEEWKVKYELSDMPSIVLITDISLPKHLQG